MEEFRDSSRRNFLLQAATGVVGLTLTSAFGEALGNPETMFGSDGRSEAPLAPSEKKLVPVMITPFKTDGRIDFDGVSRLTDFYLAAGAKGFFANCLSSEMYFIDERERVALTQHVTKYVNNKVSVVSTGSFGDNLVKQSECTKEIYGTGVDAVILITSHFASKGDSDDVLIGNFEKFFGLTGNIPLGTYECPSPYKRLVTSKVFQALLSSNRLIYHKDTSEDINKIKENLSMLKGSKLAFFNAHTATALPSLQLGGAGLSPISANFYPEIMAWLCANANNPAKSEDARWIQDELKKMEPVISKGYPVSSKYFLIKRGMKMEMLVRSKRTLTPEQMAGLDDAHKVFLGWCDRLAIKPVRF
jgi:4-hydroxy-tetrahydrodipicolinate synthase